MKSYNKYRIRLTVLSSLFFMAFTGFLLSKSNSETHKEEKPPSITEKKSMPSFFEGTLQNVITDSANSLAPFFEKLMQLRSINTVDKPVVRILHIGDSHVRSHEFTPVFNLRLTEIFGNAALTCIEGYKSNGIVEESGECGIACHCIGINGATSKNFSEDKYLKEISGLNPDLIIISLGTNESLGKYDSVHHYGMMENLFNLLTEACPKAVTLYTTPPGAFKPIYSKARRRRNRKIIAFEENSNTQHIASTIKQFAANHNSACWDLFNIVGGNENACENWLAGNFYKHDRLHFLKEGYELHGNLLCEALIDGYNKYVLHKK